MIRPHSGLGFLAPQDVFGRFFVDQGEVDSHASRVIKGSCPRIPSMIFLRSLGVREGPSVNQAVLPHQRGQLLSLFPCASVDASSFLRGYVPDVRIHWIGCDVEIPYHDGWDSISSNHGDVFTQFT